MTTYVALLRGIAPMNPAMRNENLRRVVEELGHREVRTVISSGNVLFESNRRSTARIEREMEEAWPERLGFNSTTIVRSRQQIERLVQADPYGTLEHGRTSYLLATFFKRPPELPFELPFTPPGLPLELVAMVDGTLFSVTDTTVAGTPDLMVWLEREFGKELSSRTWKTVQRILAKM